MEPIDSLKLTLTFTLSKITDHQQYDINLMAVYLIFLHFLKVHPKYNICIAVDCILPGIYHTWGFVGGGGSVQDVCNTIMHSSMMHNASSVQLQGGWGVLSGGLSQVSLSRGVLCKTSL